MLEKTMRKVCQHYFVDPVMPWLPKRLSPAYLTVASGVSGLLCALAIAGQYPFTATFFLLVSGWLDMADGTFARFQSNPTSLGATLDIFVDRVVESAIVLGIFLQSPTDRGLMSIFMLISILLCITSFLVVGIFTINQTNKGFYYNPGLMERPEAFVFFILIIFLPKHFTILAISFSLLVLWTAVHRIFEFIKLNNSTH